MSVYVPKHAPDTYFAPYATFKQSRFSHAMVSSMLTAPTGRLVHACATTHATRARRSASNAARRDELIAPSIVASDRRIEEREQVDDLLHSAEYPSLQLDQLIQNRARDALPS